MEYRRLGSTGLNVSKLCLGTWTFGWVTDEGDALDIMSAAAKAGCNFIDTANRYGRPTSHAGTSEEFVGKWLSKQSRDRFVVATKVRGRMGCGPNDEGLSRSHILREVEASLRRLQTDYIDLYWMHWPDPETPLEETLRALDFLVHQGKVRYVGCSNFPAWLLTKSLWISDKHRWCRFEAIQAHYNLVHRAEVERETLDLCLDQGIGLISYSPLEEGFLTGKYQPGREVSQDSRASIRREVRDKFTGKNFAILAQLEEIAVSQGKTPAQIAIAWILTRPAVTSAIIGARKIDQLIENFEAVDIRLSPEEINLLDKVSTWLDDRTPLVLGQSES